MFNLRSRLLNFLKRPPKKEPEPSEPPEPPREPERESILDELAQRVRRTAESILDSESLTSDLDDDAAKTLLDWGMDSARRIAQSTSGLNAAEAEDAMYPRLRAIRRLMRRVNRWVARRQEMEADESASLVAEIVEQASIVYGRGPASLSHERISAFVQRQSDLNAPQLVAALRDLLEDATHGSAADQEE
jgi:hypothetical protein